LTLFKLQYLLFSVFIIYYLLNILAFFAQIIVQNYVKDKFVKLNIKQFHPNNRYFLSLNSEYYFHLMPT